MRPRSVLLLACLLAGCPSSATRPGSLEQLGAAGEDCLCAGTLADAIEEVRGTTDEEGVPRLVGAVRWSSRHAHLECNPVISARHLWQESVRALGRIGGESARLGLVLSLSESHRPGSVHDRHNAASRLETATALRMLRQPPALEPAVVEALLDWYGEGALDCSVDSHRRGVAQLLVDSGEPGLRVLARRFPPSREDGRCAPGWLLSDIFEEVPAPLQAQIFDELSQGGGEDRRTRIAGALQTTTGPLRQALERLACDAALETAVTSFEGEDADPASAVDEAVETCGANADVVDDIAALRQRLTEWHVERGEAEEAWRVLETLPEGDVDPRWRSEVGVPVIFARLERGALMEAVEMLEALSAEVGADHTDLQPVRGVMERALFAAAEQSLEASSLPDVQLLVGTARRLFGESDGTRRFDFVVRLAEAAAIASEDECRPRREIRRLHPGVEAARDQAAEVYGDDESVTSLAQATWRRWRAMVRRCY